jgi:hypothetical protein
MRLKILIFFAGICSMYVSAAQDINGTWLGSYYRDLPGNKRMFYYRFYLERSQDTIYGICETLDPSTDLRGTNPAQAAAVKKIRVHDYHFNAANKIESITLMEGAAFDIHTPGDEADVPIFNVYRCFFNQQYANDHQLIFSNLPAMDGNQGNLQMKKLSDKIPDHILPYMLPSGQQAKMKRRLKKDGSIFSQKKTESMQDEKELPIDERAQEVQSSLMISSGIVMVDLYDNGVIDNDSVSLYLNGKILLEGKKLGLDPYHFELQLNSEIENRFVLIAHNLGTIPPNTALLTLTVGDKKYHVNLASTLRKNAVAVISVSAGSK